MRIVDLFSGAGGLTFGFYYKKKDDSFIKNQENSFAFANELDPYAAKAFSLNYPDIVLLNQDIRTIDEETVKRLIGNEPIDLVIGGPPCQSFSTVGQRRFDDKAKLYEEYYRILKIIKPKMFLFENVKGLLSMREVFYKLDKEGNIIFEDSDDKEKTSLNPRKRPVVDHYGDLIIDILRRQFEEIGYSIEYDTINAVDYGIPQNRERVVIIGCRNDLHLQWTFPEATCQTALTIKEAISDLPRVGEGQNKKKYTKDPQNAYQRLMRGKCETITHHCCGKYGDKIKTVIKHVKQGQGKDDFNKLVDEGVVKKEYKLTSGYANTYGRLVAKLPSPTITNNMSTPSALRCIHYRQNRALTPREGARIQSFPDWFVFCGSKENVTAQIGNAVPPLLALCFAQQIKSVLEGRTCDER